MRVCTCTHVCLICTHAALSRACHQELGNGSLERCYPTSPASSCHLPNLPIPATSHHPITYYFYPSPHLSATPLSHPPTPHLHLTHSITSPPNPSPPSSHHLITTSPPTLSPHYSTPPPSSCRLTAHPSPLLLACHYLSLSLVTGIRGGADSQKALP